MVGLFTAEIIMDFVEGLDHTAPRIESDWFTAAGSDNYKSYGPMFLGWPAISCI